MVLVNARLTIKPADLMLFYSLWQDFKISENEWFIFHRRAPQTAGHRCEFGFGLMGPYRALPIGPHIGPYIGPYFGSYFPCGVAHACGWGPVELTQHPQDVPNTFRIYPTPSEFTEHLQQHLQNLPNTFIIYPTPSEFTHPFRIYPPLQNLPTPSEFTHHLQNLPTPSLFLFPFCCFHHEGP